MEDLSQEFQKSVTPEQVLQALREGNHRFVNNSRLERDLLEQVSQTSAAQYPLSIIVNCIDSRTPTELIFDQGLGSVFSVRIAGSVITEDVLGSMEFACKISGAKLIVLLNHTKCGAVKGACDNAQLGNLTALLSKIRPAVELEKTVKTERNSKNAEFVNKVTDIHARRSLATILEESPVLREMIEKGEIGIISGIYNVDTGSVEFLEDTFMLGEIKNFFPADENTGEPSPTDAARKIV